MSSGSLALMPATLSMDDMNKGAMSIKKKDKDNIDKDSMGTAPCSECNNAQHLGMACEVARHALAEM